MAKDRRTAAARLAGDRRAQAVAGGLVGAAAVAAGKAGIERLTRQDRAYRLRRKESARDGVIRIGLGRADDALDHLERARKGELATGVHEARKDLKKLRSLLRLVRGGLGKKAYRRENRRYRDAARTLAGARDAEIRLRTLKGLVTRHPEDLGGPDIAVVREQLERELPADAGNGEISRQLDGAAASITAGRALIGEWPLDRDGWELIEPGLRRSYRRGRKRLKRLRSEPTDEAAHEWRKRVKDLWYHLRVLRDAAPDELGPAADAAHDLSDLLGDHHDLAVLREWLRSLPEAPPATLHEAIARRQQELLAVAVELGESIYAERPRRFSERLGGHWEQWRG